MRVNLPHSIFMIEQKGFLNRQPVFFQMMLLIFLVFACTYIFTIAAMVIVGPLYGIDGADTLILKAVENPQGIKENMNELNAIKLIQFFSSLGTFLIPALLFGFTKGMGTDFLKLRSKISVLILVAGMALIYLSAPLVNEIYNLNKLIDAKWLGNFGNELLESDKKNKLLTDLFLFMPNAQDLLINIFVVALIPAIAEELFFRGVLQQLFKESFKSVHLSVWITAMLFSFIHLDFYGFIPRVLLGALLGYLFVWSNSMVVNIGAHFINNASQIVMVYFFQSGVISFDAQSDESMPWYITLLFSLVMVGLIIFIYKKRVIEKEPEPEIIPDSIFPDNNYG